MRVTGERLLAWPARACAERLLRMPPIILQTVNSSTRAHRARGGAVRRGQSSSIASRKARPRTRGAHRAKSGRAMAPAERVRMVPRRSRKARGNGIRSSAAHPGIGAARIISRP